MTSFSLRQMRIFLAVAEGDGMASAARSLVLSVATVSEALRDLEAELGQALFDRSGRRLRLSSAGQALLPDARNLLRDADRIGRSHAGRPRLTLGASVTVGNYILPPLIVELSKHHPEIEIEVVIRNTRTILDLLLDHAVEAAVVEGEAAHPALSVRPWRRDALVVFASPEHPLAKGADIAALADAPWILREHGSGTRETFDAAAAAWPTAPRTLMTVGGNELLKSAVAAGLGLGCLARAAVAAELTRGDLVEVTMPGSPMERTLSLVERVRSRRSDALHLFLETCVAPVQG